MMMTSLSLAKQISSLFYKILLTFWHLRLFLILGAVFVVYNVYSGVWAGFGELTTTHPDLIQFDNDPSPVVTFIGKL